MSDATDPQALFYAAFAKAQGSFGTIPREKTVKVTTKTGSSYSFKYAPLEAILAAVRPQLAENGLALTQQLTMNENRFPVLETRILHAGGGFITGRFPLKTDGLSAQELGSLVTYMRRYAIVCALGIATEEDDDGNHAAGNDAKPARAAAKDGENPFDDAPTRSPEHWAKQAALFSEYEKLAQAYKKISPEFDLEKAISWARPQPPAKLKEATEKLAGLIDGARLGALQ